MKWVRDNSGRFQTRPHYLPEELDCECESVVTEFLCQKYGKSAFPIATDDLTCLLEREAEDLDPYADFSGEEGQVEGVTEFRLGRKPAVKISVILSEAHMENRLRTTLTHEYGHVHFHNCMFQIEDMPSLFGDQLAPQTSAHHANRCKRDSIVSMDNRDWMEWQAGYVCGAMLMPITSLVNVVKGYRQRCGLEFTQLIEKSPEGANLITEVANTFQTSRDAARVRLSQQRMLSPSSPGSLFK